MATDAQLQPTLVPGNLDDFLELETRIERVVEALRVAREARVKAEAEVAELRTKFSELKRDYTRSEQELITLRKERDEVRQRLERLAKRLDSLAQ